jgi:N-acetylglucosaminyldiphosphoundecaprenol N-acetyl-beta-D-mannosaminyltransferase
MVIAASPATPETVKLFGIALHRIRLAEVIAMLLRWIEEGSPCRYVVTPNVDHIVKLQSYPAMQAAYQNASLIVADGWPLVAASRWLGQPLPERVAGSDLVPGLFSAGNSIPNFRLFLLGGAPGVAERAAERIHARWRGVRVCGVASPPPGFEVDAEQTGRIVGEINSASPHLLVVGLGAPKQEIWLNENASKLEVPVAIAAGATIDFLAGVQKRAPVWIQRLRLEWMFRLMSDPKRLAGRYALDAIVFPRLVAAEWRRLRAEASRRPCGNSRYS